MSQNINKKQKNFLAAKKQANEVKKIKENISKKNTNKKKIKSKPVLIKTVSMPLLAKKPVGKIKGKGDYSIKDAYNDVFDKDTVSEGFVNKAAKKIGETVGNTFGFGRELGNAASRLSKIFGFGDYSIDQPKVINHRYPIHKNSFVTNSPPTFSGSKGEDVIITRREYVNDLTASIGFSAKKYFLNPGNPELFPWLSNFAKGYEEYQFLGLVFEFKSTASSAAADGGGLPSVFMATDYDCLDENYSDKRTMEASEFANSCKASYSFLHPIECDPKRNVLGKMFILPGITNVSQINAPGTSAFGDPRFDTLGQTYIATQGAESGTSGSALGEMWVTYKVRLSRPMLEVGAASDGLIQTFTCQVGTTGALEPLPSGNICDVRTKGGVGFSFIGYSASTTSGTISLGYNGNTRGFFMIHVSGRVANGAGSSWYVHSTNTVNSSFGQWNYDYSLLKTNATPGYTYQTDFRTSGFNDSTSGTNYKCQTSTHIGWFLPHIAYTNHMTAPLYVNSAVKSLYVITVIGIPDPTLMGSRVRELLWNNVSLNQSKGFLPNSDYLREQNQTSSKDEIDSSKHHGCQDDDDDDFEESDDPDTAGDDDIPCNDEILTKKISKKRVDKPHSKK